MPLALALITLNPAKPGGTHLLDPLELDTRSGVALEGGLVILRLSVHRQDAGGEVQQVQQHRVQAGVCRNREQFFSTLLAPFVIDTCNQLLVTDSHFRSNQQEK